MGPCRIPSEPALASLQELLRPAIVQALGDPLAPAQLGNAGLAAKPVQHDADFLFSRILLPRGPADVFYNVFGRPVRCLGFLMEWMPPPTASLMTMPGIGPIAAMAIQAFAPPPENFRSGRDFAAWTGLVPLQKSTGGKQILGKTSKMGQRDIRRLLIIGAMAVIRWAARKKAPAGTWLARMMARKPPMVVATALANKMARTVWTMMITGKNYRNSAATA